MSTTAPAAGGQPSEAERREAAAWSTWQESPWGRLRYRVVAALLRGALAQLGPAPLRVLDAGGGDGRDALQLALAGHAVTVLDTSPDVLGAARAAAAAAGVEERLHTVAADLEDLAALAALTRHRAGGSGSFDVVLCHDVLQHRAGTGQVAADVATLASSLRPGGLLSLLAPNPAADVLTAALREGPAQAWVLLDAERGADPGTGRSVLRLEPGTVEAALAAAGCEVVARHGVLTVTALLEDAERADERSVADLEELEVELSRRDEFRRTARYWHLLARRR
ncbi:methyltransferase domain-containing protein [Kineococcus indalonis]|uniref:methyltransferase domain-containing protein n=1 Tax=Kineococcus indalonis TaxID=2696566 RepID=UPI00141208AF|nr:methyltransferase domain-containing protein [Kineococcus indalonis]NAZ88214.1 methyltransferase domain-containing protein [Kineococcus indalonis]